MIAIANGHGAVSKEYNHKIRIITMKNDLTMWTAIVSFALPLLVAVIQQPRWGSKARVLVATMSSIVAGFGTVYFTSPEQFNGSTTATVILTIMVASTAVYESYWSSTGITNMIEIKTSPNDEIAKIMKEFK